MSSRFGETFSDHPSRDPVPGSGRRFLLAAKIAVVPGLDIVAIASAIDDAEARVRERLLACRNIYLEPDLFRAAEIPG